MKDATELRVFVLECDTKKVGAVTLKLTHSRGGKTGHDA